MIVFDNQRKEKKNNNLKIQNQKVWSVKYNLKESSKEHTNSLI